MNGRRGTPELVGVLSGRHGSLLDCVRLFFFAVCALLVSPSSFIELWVRCAIGLLTFQMTTFVAWELAFF